MKTNIKIKRHLSKPDKDRIAGKQRFKCANNPGSQLKHLENFDCPLWQNNGIFKGNFGESGFQIDHIEEFVEGGSDEDNNLQALCMDCHAIKTKKYLSLKKKNITYQCRKCGYETFIKSRYTAHLKRKKPCKKNINAQNNITISLIHDDVPNEETNMDLDVGNIYA